MRAREKRSRAAVMQEVQDSILRLEKIHRDLRETMLLMVDMQSRLGLEEAYKLSDLEAELSGRAGRGSSSGRD